MKNTIGLGIAVLFFIVNAAQATVISITGVQATTGSNYNFSANLTNDQPATDPYDGEAQTGTGSAFGVAGTNPVVILDFGEDYATKTFTDIYLLQGTYGTKDWEETYFWSSGLEPDFGAGDIVATDYSIFDIAGHSSGSNAIWDLQYSDAGGQTPLLRYLKITPGAGDLGNFIYEVAFVNVPEPTTMGLLALGGTVLLKRRRK